MSNSVTLDPTTITLIASYKTTLAKQTELADIAATLKAAIIAALSNADNGLNPDGEILVTHKPTRSFDPSIAKAFLSPEQISAASPPTFNATLAKKQLTGEQLDQSMVLGSSRRFSIA